MAMSAEHRSTFAAVPRWWSEKFSSGTTIHKQTNKENNSFRTSDSGIVKFSTVAHVCSGTTQVSLDILQIENSNAKGLAIKVNLISTLNFYILSKWVWHTSTVYLLNGYRRQSYFLMNNILLGIVTGSYEWKKSLKLKCSMCLCRSRPICIILEHIFSDVYLSKGLFYFERCDGVCIQI